MDRQPPGKPTDERKAVGQVLRQARVLRGLSQEKAAEAAKEHPDAKGMSQQTWAQIEKGARAIDVSELDMLARAAGIDRETLDEEVAKLIGRAPGRKASVTPIHQPEMLPVRRRVQAGAFLQADELDQDRPRLVPAAFDPRFPREAQYLSEVVGSSVDQLRIFDGDYVHCVDIQAIGYAPITDDIVEVERGRFGGREREYTLKQVEVTADGAVLWPRSSDPRYQEPVDLREGVPNPENIQVQMVGLVLGTIRLFRRP